MADTLDELMRMAQGSKADLGNDETEDEPSTIPERLQEPADEQGDALDASEEPEVATKNHFTGRRGPNKVTSQKMFEWIRKNDGCTPKEVAEAFGVKTGIIYNHANRLQEKGLLTVERGQGFAEESHYHAVVGEGVAIRKPGRPAKTATAQPILNKGGIKMVTIQDFPGGETEVFITVDGRLYYKVEPTEALPV